MRTVLRFCQTGTATGTMSSMTWPAANLCLSYVNSPKTLSASCVNNPKTLIASCVNNPKTLQLCVSGVVGHFINLRYRIRHS